MQFTQAWRRCLVAAAAVAGLAGCASTASPTPPVNVGYTSPPVTPSSSATVVPTPTPRPGTMLVTPAYGTDGSLVEVAVSGAQPNEPGSVALCSLSAPGIPAGCDPDAYAVETDHTGSFTADYTISQVPASSKKGYAVVFLDLAGGVLASASFNPDIQATPTPYPTYSHPTATARSSH